MKSIGTQFGADAQHEPSKLGLLLVLCLAWLIPGLVGHGPWRPDEAGTFAVIYHMLQAGEWLVPTLAGESYLKHGPLYYWTASGMAWLFSWAMPLHDAARLTSGLYMALTLVGLGMAARELYGPSMPRLAVALLIGCVGLIAHAHEMITDTALLAGYALVLWGLALSLRRPNPAGMLLGLGLGIAFLSRNVVPVAVVGLALALLPAFAAWRTRVYVRTVLIGVLISLPFLLLWPALLYGFAREDFLLWWHMENWPQLSKFSLSMIRTEFEYFIQVLPWFAWPVLPISLWTLWGYRKKLWHEPVFQLPLVFSLVTLGFVILNAEARDIHALPVLLPLTLLALPGAETLRRGAANALGWFGIMMFGLLAFFIWFSWLTLMTEVPARFFNHLLKLQPGFVPRLEWLPLIVAVLLTILWLLPLRHSFRSGRRAVFHWAAGITLMWGLAATLLLPWIDHGKSYAGVMTALKQHLPESYRCIGSAGLGEPQRGVLYYYAGVVTQRTERNEFEAYGCDLFLLQTHAQRADARPGEDWTPIWQGHRPGDKFELLVMYKQKAAVE